jgi:hypothetical protein
MEEVFKQIAVIKEEYASECKEYQAETKNTASTAIFPQLFLRLTSSNSANFLLFLLKMLRNER